MLSIEEILVIENACNSNRDPNNSVFNSSLYRIRVVCDTIINRLCNHRTLEMIWWDKLKEASHPTSGATNFDTASRDRFLVNASFFIHTSFGEKANLK